MLTDALKWIVFIAILVLTFKTVYHLALVRMFVVCEICGETGSAVFGCSSGQVLYRYRDPVDRVYCGNCGKNLAAEIFKHPAYREAVKNISRHEALVAKAKAYNEANDTENR